MPSTAKAVVPDVCHATCGSSADVACAKAGHTCTNAGHACAKATYVTGAKAAHVASAKTAAMAAASTATATGLCVGSKQAAGERHARQNHHHSSSHDILLWDGRTVRRMSIQTPALSRAKRRRRDGVKMGMLTVRPY
jgi:hypothetical protein